MILSSFYEQFPRFSEVNLRLCGDAETREYIILGVILDSEKLRVETVIVSVNMRPRTIKLEEFLSLVSIVPCLECMASC